TARGGRTAPWESRAAGRGWLRWREYQHGGFGRSGSRRASLWRAGRRDWHRLEQDCGIRKRDAVLREEIREAVHVYSALIRDTPPVSAREMRAEAAKLALAAKYVADHVSQVVLSEIGRIIGRVGALLVILVPEVVAGRMTGGDLV